MRISDWSSDVCSSDLESNPKCSHVRDTCLDEEPNGPCKVTERTFKCPIPNSPPTDVKEYVCGGSMYCINGSCSEIEAEASNEFKDEIGRASCRERVCQYV